MCCSCSVVSGDASASKPDEVKRLPGGKLKKKVGPLHSLLRIHLIIASLCDMNILFKVSLEIQVIFRDGIIPP